MLYQSLVHILKLETTSGHLNKEGNIAKTCIFVPSIEAIHTTAMLLSELNCVGWFL